MQTVLKGGGLIFSSGLTLSLFFRLFGYEANGFFMAISALALFEGGAFGWAQLLKTAREGQRVVATTCLVIAVTLSLFSSGLELVLATELGAKSLGAFDFGFLTLCAIVLALASNLIGALLFEARNPDERAETNRLEFDAGMANIQHMAQMKVLKEARTSALDKMRTLAPSLSRMISDRALRNAQDAVAFLSRDKNEDGLSDDSASESHPATVSKIASPKTKDDYTEQDIFTEEDDDVIIDGSNGVLPGK